MASLHDLVAISRCVSNSIDPNAIGAKSLTGIIGDAPSHYSKSPQLWNAAFKHLSLDAIYLPFDTDDAKLGDLLAALKDSGRFLGANVTVPHKVRLIDFVDDIDPGAARINAINTIVRTSNGRLIGYNTDGEGFVESILKRQPGQGRPFLTSLRETDVLLLGAGGSARAVAFHVADLLEKGRLLICNRTLKQAIDLAKEIQGTGRNTLAIAEEDLCEWAPKAGLIVNSTTKGQGGVRKLARGIATLLESYSALAPAHPPSLVESDFARADFPQEWERVAGSDIQANHRASMELAKSIPPETAFYDLIYHPEETVFLRHARITGHPTMNGKAMIVNQAVIAFCQRICRAQLQARGMDTPASEQRILEIMYAAW
ncbi:MAG: shikimate dehydrogenase family protein [Chloroflexota bacterium]